ncbi:MAG: hypothetical protein ABUK01_07585 [Leptospirales bacterium]
MILFIKIKKNKSRAFYNAIRAFERKGLFYFLCHFGLFSFRNGGAEMLDVPFLKEKRGTSQMSWVMVAVLTIVGVFVVGLIIKSLVINIFALDEPTAFTISLFLTFLEMAVSIGVLIYYYDQLKKNIR